MNNQISFKANYIESTRILLKNNSRPKNVSFIQLDPESSADLTAIQRVKRLWNDSATFAFEICEEMTDCTDFFEHAGKKFFAITEQKDHLENLNPNKILGLAEVIDVATDKLKLKFLQTHPEHKYGMKSAKFKHIGAAMINSIQNIFPNKNIFGEATESAQNFYLAQGFELNISQYNIFFSR